MAPKKVADKPAEPAPIPLSFKDTIPVFYRKFFLIVDPTIAIWGVYLNTFSPETVINSVIPSGSTIAPTNPLHTYLFSQINGALLFCVFLDVFLLRNTSEVWIWKTQQYGQLIYDIVILAGFGFALSEQGRGWVGNWRVEDWGTIGITGGCGLVRALFCAGIGFGTLKKGKKES